MSICAITLNMDGQCSVFSSCLPGDKEHLLVMKLRATSEALDGGVYRTCRGFPELEWVQQDLWLQHLGQG